MGLGVRKHTERGDSVGGQLVNPSVPVGVVEGGGGAERVTLGATAEAEREDVTRYVLLRYVIALLLVVLLLRAIRWRVLGLAFLA